MQVFEQSISSGSNFDGTAPVGTAVETNGVKRYPIGTAGGLFDFGQKGPVVLDAIDLVLGGQTAWTLTRFDSEGFETLLWTGTTESSWVALASDATILVPGDTLKLVTTGTTTSDIKARLATRKAAL
jgi:hypothetical protein